MYNAIRLYKKRIPAGRRPGFFMPVITGCPAGDNRKTSFVGWVSEVRPEPNKPNGEPVPLLGYALRARGCLQFKPAPLRASLCGRPSNYPLPRGGGSGWGQQTSRVSDGIQNELQTAPRACLQFDPPLPCEAGEGQGGGVKNRVATASKMNCKQRQAPRLLPLPRFANRIIGAFRVAQHIQRHPTFHLRAATIGAGRQRAA